MGHCREKMISQRVREVSPSPTLAITSKAKQLKSEGVDVISLAAGEPDFDTPEHIKQAAYKALKEGKSKYTPTSGIPELREAVAEKLERENGLKYDPSEVIITCGAKSALYLSFQAICNPGDEVIIPSPYWVTYPEQVKLAGAKPVTLETKREEGFKIDPDELERLVTPNTKAIILNSPNNPSGAVFSREELEKIARISLKAGIWIISDEVYEKIIYDGREHVSIASLSEEVKQHTITINALSKTYSMTGWRVGYAAGPGEVISAMNYIQSHSVSHPTSFAQYAAVTAIKGDQSCVRTLTQAFARRREIIFNLAREIPQFEVSPPEGTFYLFPLVKGICSERIKGSLELCQYLLEEAKVAVIPGGEFGAEGHMRISFAASEEDIEEGMHRIKEALRRIT